MGSEWHPGLCGASARSLFIARRCEQSRHAGAPATRRACLASWRALKSVFFALALSACAGREPHPVAAIQYGDDTASCPQIQAETQANTVRLKELADEESRKTAENVGNGIGGVVFFPLWFGMDLKGAAAKESAALQARQQRLAALASERCTAPAPRRG
jgi:hypothetical protein